MSSAASESCAAIIPAYNEAGRIGSVLAVLSRVAALSEIIVVDDGSTDDTCCVVEQARQTEPRLQLVRHPANRGKGAALLTGAAAAESRALLLLDADLVGLRPEHVEALVEPVTAGRVDMTLGLFRGGPLHTELAHRVTPWLSGQRCLRAGLLQRICAPAAAGYGIETALALAARRERWRCARVFLRGVSHPSVELRRGVFPGLQTRARMYRDIAAAWARATGWRLPALRLSLPARFALTALLALCYASVAYDRSRAGSRFDLDDLAALPIAQAERLLVIAPHPDDETLGSGGAIQAALAAGADVKVVVVTNGDGQLFGPLALRGRFVPRPADYVREGELRQAETLAALQTLGVEPASVIALGYPDGDMARLWLSDWTRDCPVRARLTRVERSPYSTDHQPQPTYCGSDVVSELSRVVADYRPDLVLIPHPNDEHPDHAAVSNFARLAVGQVSQADPAYQPGLWGYLVHYGYYPQPRGLRLGEALLPPIPLSGAGAEWARLSLTAEQIQTKAMALQAYTTQQRLLGSFLNSFARADEIFARLDTLPLPSMAIGQALPSNVEWFHQADWFDPSLESTRRLLVAGSDLVDLKAARVGNRLWIAAETRGPLLEYVEYQILVKTPDGRTLARSWPGAAQRIGPASFALELDLEDLSDPPLLGFAAVARRGVTLDRTAWHFVLLGEAGP